MQRFKAYRLEEVDRKMRAGFVECSLDELDPGEVVVRVAYSDVNYKDALAATGKGRILLRPSCIGGIDLAGTVVSSTDPGFAKGDAVLAVGHDIGVIGVLDDVTTGQVAVVDQLRHANPTLGSIELFRRASTVGREHIISLVNTLALAYAGVSLPLFLMFANNPQPLWISLNGEFFAEEIIRTLVGSTALVLAVPITTFLAARFLAGTSDSVQLHTHHH